MWRLGPIEIVSTASLRHYFNAAKELADTPEIAGSFPQPSLRAHPIAFSPSDGERAQQRSVLLQVAVTEESILAHVWPSTTPGHWWVDVASKPIGELIPSAEVPAALAPVDFHAESWRPLASFLTRSYNVLDN